MRISHLGYLTVCSIGLAEHRPEVIKFAAELEAICIVELIFIQEIQTLFLQTIDNSDQPSKRRDMHLGAVSFRRIHNPCRTIINELKDYHNTASRAPPDEKRPTSLLIRLSSHVRELKRTYTDN